jgi:hypothetical protein
LGNESLKKVLFLRKFWGMGVGRKFAFFESFWGMEESTLSSKVLGDGRKYAFFESFGEWKKVRFLQKFWGKEESTLSSKFFWGKEESTLSSKVIGNGGWKKVLFLLKYKIWRLGEFTYCSTLCFKNARWSP